MRLVQFLTTSGARRVAVVQDETTLQLLQNTTYVRDLALAAHRAQQPLTVAVEARLSDKTVNYEEVIADNRLLPPLDHPDPAHCILSGTGLDHLGSAQARDSMHAKLNTGSASARADALDTGSASARADALGSNELTDSMKMFKLGLEGGKPAPGQIGVQPEWFYKGDGSWLVAPGHGLPLPPYALDGGEEPELVGLYVIGDHGEVLRVGFALGNEFSDHVLEKQNYLYLAHSKLRNSSFGPELLLGDPPADIRGVSRILRNGKTVWSGEFLTGEANMTHTLANIEHHHFKYSGFRRPGDVHCHYYGTATLSFAAGFRVQPGDIFEISSPDFGRPLRNPLIQPEAPDRLIECKHL